MRLIIGAKLMKVISQVQAVNLIGSTNGKIFSAIVRPRTPNKETGQYTAREYRCRLAENVTKGLKGGKLGFSPGANGLIMVYLMPGDSGYNPDDASKNRRFIAVEGILTLRIGGVDYSVPENSGAVLPA